MKSTPISKCLASILLLFIRITLVTPQLCNVRCSETMEHPPTNLYALKISENHYPTWKSTNLDVKVYRTKCPETLNTPGPAWYKIEAFTTTEKQSVGTFQDFLSFLSEELEVAVTHDKTAIEFSTWHSFAIHDLPRTFKWSKKSGNDGTICFRLTLLVDVCRQTIQCIQPRSLSTNSPVTNPPVTETSVTSGSESESGSGENFSGSYENLENEDTIPPIPAKCLNDCSNAKQGNFCSSPFDGNIYSSRCEWRVQKCALRARGVDVEKMEVKKCDDPELIEEYSIDDYKPCWEEKSKDDENWTRGCQCNGKYKPVQCGGNSKNSTDCWCSDSYGSIVSNRKLTFQCQDPETFDAYKSCTALYR